MNKHLKIFTSLIFFILTLTSCVGGSNNSSTHEHTWGSPTYIWTSDYSSCTAERVCSGDVSHKETETKNSVYTIQTHVGCETEGQGRYTVTFENIAFGTQIHDVVLNPIDHNWGTPTYEWSVDYSQCTATRVCLNDSNHIETETVDSAYQEVTVATEEMEGLGRYTATFANGFFKIQTYDIILNKLEPRKYHGEIPIISEDGQTIAYGLYPQTNVGDLDLIADLESLATHESNGWYLYNDEYYAKLETKYNNRVFDNGVSTVSGTTYWFRCEPIIWDILSIENGNYILFCTVILDMCDFIDGSAYITSYTYRYSKSLIRRWLNGLDGGDISPVDFSGVGFIDTAFASNDSPIQITNVDNSASTTNDHDNPYACEDTQDKIFLLSYADFNNSQYGFVGGESGNTYRKTTDWARARGVSYDNSPNRLFNGSYYTRSACSYDSQWISYIDKAGWLAVGAAYAFGYGVCPALTIKIA